MVQSPWAPPITISPRRQYSGNAWAPKTPEELLAGIARSLNAYGQPTDATRAGQAELHQWEEFRKEVSAKIPPEVISARKKMLEDILEICRERLEWAKPGPNKRKEDREEQRAIAVETLNRVLKLYNEPVYKEILEKARELLEWAKFQKDLDVWEMKKPR
jgi:hypothetical protein